MVFLSETKRSKTEMENFVHQLGDFTGVYVDARGRSGDLALLWDNSVSVQLLSLSLNHIDTTISLDGEDVIWRFTAIYGWSGSRDKWKTAYMISDLATHSSLSWLIRGDLNEIFYNAEKKGPPLNPLATLTSS